MSPLTCTDLVDVPTTTNAKHLTDGQLRELLDWDPDSAAYNDVRALLLAAARNRFPGGEIPLHLVPRV